MGWVGKDLPACPIICIKGLSPITVRHVGSLVKTGSLFDFVEIMLCCITLLSVSNSRNICLHSDNPSIISDKL